MKTENFPQLIFSDELYKERTRAELEDTRTALQILLDTWHELDLPKITEYRELFKVIHVPERQYAAVMSESEKAIIPIPNSLYTAARKARNQIHNGRTDLWGIVGGKVTLNTEAAEAFLNISDIWAQNEAQKSFIEACMKYTEGADMIADFLTALPTSRLPALPFVSKELTAWSPLLTKVRLEHDQMREILKLL